MRGQGSIEYLIVLSLVLIVALTVFFLLSSAPEFRKKGEMKVSRIYWKTEQDLQILEMTGEFWKDSGSETIRLVMRNNLQSEKIKILPFQIYVENCPWGVGPASEITLNPGETKVVFIWVTENPSHPIPECRFLDIKCDEGSSFSLSIKVNYTVIGRENFSVVKKGLYPITGECKIIET